ncbi:MAG TPA: class I SAM-dependent methyltransferase [Thermoanaerobaculia bacterium]|nr:class I SAM-dependent methyltransferase [Thermoanaerobaculia bacterium]
MTAPLRAVGALHGRLVFSRRARVLAREAAALLPPGRILDVGCGSGTIARAIAESRPDVAIEGFDVLVRPDAAIPVRPFDGVHIPVPDGAADAALLVDVLHHVEDPAALLAECARAARVVVVKDHLAEGPAGRALLRVMDWVGNRPHGVVLRYSYFSRTSWRAACDAACLATAAEGSLADLYPFPFSAAFGRDLHFIARLERVP